MKFMGATFSIFETTGVLILVVSLTEYTTSQFRSAHAHARSLADLLRSTRITSTSLNMHAMLAYASELRGCSPVAST